MPQTTEASHELFRRFQMDPQVIGEIYDLYANALYGFLLSRCRHRETAEDLVSQSFTKLIEARSSLEWRGVSIRAWLFTVASNALIDLKRKASTRNEIELDADWDPPSGDDPRWNAQLIIESDRIREIIGTLSARDQQILDLRYFAGLDPAEIACTLNITSNLVSVLTYRALGRLRQAAINAKLV